jgi:hypothetical protein
VRAKKGDIIVVHKVDRLTPVHGEFVNYAAIGIWNRPGQQIGATTPLLVGRRDARYGRRRLEIWTIR